MPETGRARPPVAVTPIAPAYAQIAAQLRDAIVSGTITAGVRLPTEIELASQFGVSRPTVREALRVLAAEGLVVTTKGTTGGSVVAAPSLDNLADRLRVGLSVAVRNTPVTLDDFMELRRFLETPACRVAAQRHGADDIAQLTAAIPVRGQRLADHERHGLHRDFHLALVGSCHNPLLTLATEPVFLVLQTRLDRSKLSGNFHASVTEQHRAIARALEQRDGDEAAELMQTHLEWLEPHYRRVWRPDR